MIVTVEEASRLNCVSRTQKCTGPKCMGWIWEEKEQREGPNSTVVKKVPTGKGYCGRVYK